MLEAVKTAKGDDTYTDKLQAISAADFKRRIPKIRDDDPDLDRLDRDFDSMIAYLG